MKRGYLQVMGLSFYRTNTDLEASILRISGKVAYRSKVTLSGKGLANFISSRQCPLSSNDVKKWRPRWPPWLQDGRHGSVQNQLKVMTSDDPVTRLVSPRKVS